MGYRLPYKTKQFFFVLIKLSIVVGASYFIYQKLAKNPDLEFHRFIQFTSKNGVFSSKNIIFLLFLSIFNWFLEILKWQNLISPINKISFKNAMEQSLGSLTASLFTPNRIGEYGAKAIYYLPHLRKKVMLTNLLSNMLQMSVTVAMGIIGFSFFANTYHVELDYYSIGRFLIIILSVVLLTAFGITHKRFKLKGFSIERIKIFFSDFPKQKFYIAFVLSFMRYLVFSFQFYLILSLFKVDISYLEAMSVITSMYFIASLLPSIFIFDVVIKGSIAVYLFGILGVNELIILSTITIMWLLNFAIPSIFGSYYVLNFKLTQND
ncbi:hypothetical protein EYD45_03250 [Hyunsoonleella flava]|uniref:Lysylphosphatidylglycerol synthase-like protein n=2 Tax=Hyunsoonleella flava TaxID=2527939 RepID=A0A4V2JAD7_9FLAO|nr:hypothetical protein EYD45_03250 [Hyunsoonleella flava]